MQEKDKEVEELQAKEEAIRAKYIKMMTDIKDHISVIKMGQDKLQNQISET